MFHTPQVYLRRTCFMPLYKNMTLQTPHQSILRPIWEKLFHSGINLSLILIIGLGVPRFIFASQGKFQYIIVLFLMMWIIPYVFLHKQGRVQIGMRLPKNVFWLIGTIPLGAAAAVLVHLIGYGLYGTSPQNWYINVGNSIFQTQPSLLELPKFSLFIMITIPAVIFSPLGEELFFRGLVHESFREKFGVYSATLIDATAFAITHIAHHGCNQTPVGISISWISVLIWVLLIFVTGLVFSFAKHKSGSIIGAILCHVSFNVTMQWCIVYLLF